MEPIPVTPTEFIALLYRGSTPPAGFIEFRFLPKRSRVFMPWPVFTGHPDEFKASRIPKTQDSYWGVSLRIAEGKGGAQDVHPTHLVWIDIDLKGTRWTHGQTDVQHMDPADIRACAEAAHAHYMAVFSAVDLPPRAVVYTGHGLQVYWARSSRSDTTDTEAFNRGLAAAFEGDPKTVDAARIFRLPGSWNLKNPERPLPVELWHADEAASVTREQLAQFPAPTPERAPATPEQAAQNAPSRPAGESGDVVGQWNARHPITEVLERNGYVREDSRTYTRPGDDASGRDVRLLENKRGVLSSYHHSSNDPVADGPEGEHLQEPFDLFVRLEHGGDFAGAVRAAAAELGIQGQTGRAGKITGKRDDVAQGSTPDKPGKAAKAKKDPEPTLSDFRDMVLDVSAENGQIYRYHQTRLSWWEYRRGVYEETGEPIMLQRADLILQDLEHKNLKTSFLREVLDKISRQPNIGSREVDQTPWELNALNGILDLEHGTFREHTPEYFSTIQSAAAYIPEAVAHEWLAFLAEAVPSQKDRDTLQEYAGLCLTGYTATQRALLLVGAGGTGKSTFVRVLAAVLVSLATSSALEVIKDGSFIIGNLVGRRMCVVSELQRNVDWLPFKRITGEDTVSVDVKNKTPFTTKLDLKLIILSNVVPFLGDDTTNNSLMRRFLPVSFDVKPAEPDPTLESRLIHPSELPGVLNWMLEGLARLRQKDMRFPAGLGKLGREIVEESNRVIGFIQDRCRADAAGEVGSSELYSAYRDWCGETGHKPLSSTSFPKQLVMAGGHFGQKIERAHKRNGTTYSGLVLSAVPSGWETPEVES